MITFRIRISNNNIRLVLLICLVWQSGCRTMKLTSEDYNAAGEVGLHKMYRAGEERMLLNIDSSFYVSKSSSLYAKGSVLDNYTRVPLGEVLVIHMKTYTNDSICKTNLKGEFCFNIKVNKNDKIAFELVGYKNFYIELSKLIK